MVIFTFKRHTVTVDIFHAIAACHHNISTKLRAIFSITYYPCVTDEHLAVYIVTYKMCEHISHQQVTKFVTLY